MQRVSTGTMVVLIAIVIASMFLAGYLPIVTGLYQVVINNLRLF